MSREYHHPPFNAPNMARGGAFDKAEPTHWGMWDFQIIPQSTPWRGFTRACCGASGPRRLDWDAHRDAPDPRLPSRERFVPARDGWFLFFCLDTCNSAEFAIWPVCRTRARFLSGDVVRSRMKLTNALSAAGICLLLGW